MQKFLVLTLLLATACATRSPSAATTTPAPPAQATKPACEIGEPEAQLGTAAQRPASELVATLGTGIDPYHRQDGQWLARAPVMVNEPFDFAQAMGLGAVGAGLAAATRQKNNHARAEQLASQELSAEAARHVDALRACGIHRWVLAWGTGESAETHLITERYDATGKRVETREKVLPGELAFDDATWLSRSDEGAVVVDGGPPADAAQPPEPAP